MFTNFSTLSRPERFERLLKMGALLPSDIALLQSAVHADYHELAENFIENALGGFPLPLGMAAHFRMNNKDYAVPMAIEETSVIAAVSNMSKWIKKEGDIQARVLGENIIGQICLINISDVTKLSKIKKMIMNKKKYLINLANTHSVPNLVSRGGGVADIIIQKNNPENKNKNKNKKFYNNTIIIQVLLNPCEAMGANLINQVCEFLKTPIETLTGETVSLCILSNLVDTRLTEVNITINNINPELGQAIQDISVLGENDPYRAATHNKGVMNGMDAVAIATGNDWRALEAGVHAYAARDGQYRAISQWRMIKEHGNQYCLNGYLKAPVIVGIVGGVTRLHPLAKWALRIMNIENAAELSCVIAAIGLVQNLGALRALGSGGIVEGHMTLHIKNLLLAVGASEKEQIILFPELKQFVKKHRKITESDVSAQLLLLRESQ